MRRSSLLVVLLAALAFSSSAAASPLFVLSGRGWGHGIGMSQYGAQGFALHGWTHQQILAHYYRNTALGSATGPARVLLTSGRSRFTLASPATISGAGKSLAAGSYTVTRSGSTVLAGGKSFPSGTKFTSSRLLSVDGSRYRGRIQVFAGSGLAVVNELNIDSYVQGVVPNESPASWHPEALQAQADAARSYALAAGGHCGSALVGANVLCRGTSDQVYGGFESEEDTTNAAVAATRGEVVTYGSPARIATTFFFSTSGGSTVNKAEEWGGSDVSYLQTEGDPYDNISPHHRWGSTDAEEDCPGGPRDCVYTAAGMSDRLGIARIRDLRVGARNSGNRVERVDIGTPGGTATRTGAQIRSELGLRSTWFSIGVLNIAPSKRKSACRTRVRLDVTSRNVTGVTLQQRPVTGGAWQNLATEPAGADSFSFVHRPCQSTIYRLPSSAANGASVQVNVAPLILFNETQPAGGTALKGTVRPLSMAGRTVKVDRKRADGTWRLVGTATVATDGTWKAVFQVVEGVYRARITPPSGSGLVPGVSPPLTVTFH
jgi:stage II sporulation protein D